MATFEIEVRTFAKKYEGHVLVRWSMIEKII